MFADGYAVAPPEIDLTAASFVAVETPEYFSAICSDQCPMTARIVLRSAPASAISVFQVRRGTCGVTFCWMPTDCAASASGSTKTDVQRGDPASVVVPC